MRRHRYPRRCCAVVGLLAACAGGAPTGDIAGGGPPLEFVCGWEPGPPRAARVLVDLRLRSGNENRTPTDADVRAIATAGGRVRHRFAVALVRAELDTAAVRALITGPRAVGAYAVTVVDARRLDAQVQVFYTRAVTAADEAALAAAGARAIMAAPRPVRYATVGDAAIPAVAALPGVEFVRALALTCGTPD